MLIEFHILQNFAPSNLNRDDTGAPKDCIFGGYRRLRISSQCLKSSMRRMLPGLAGLTAEELGVRTRRVLDYVVPKLMEDGHSQDDAEKAVIGALRRLNLKTKSGGESQYLLFLSRKSLDNLTSLCRAHFDALAEEGTAGKKTGGKAKAKDTLQQDLDNLLAVGRAVDIALFGRMIADIPDRNVHAACQVAHALSTHKVDLEFDYYTALDDLRPTDTSGAGMVGILEFGSATFYRYSNLHCEQLRDNLHGEVELSVQAVKAYAEANIYARPSGKQNAFAAHNPPSLVMAVVREGALPVSLANAFVGPVAPTNEQDLVDRSISELAKYWEWVRTTYGAVDILGTWYCAPPNVGIQTGSRLASTTELVEAVVNTARQWFAESR
jgi:CRISPR system Cascade subunit CasC